MTKHPILGIGGPLIDHLLHVDPDFVQSIGGSTGGATTIDANALAHIVSKYSSNKQSTLGGSTSNTLRGLSHLGHECSFLGAVGNDTWAGYITNALQQHGIQNLLYPYEEATGQVLCLITPDGQRTMRAHLGASQKLQKEHLDKEHFQNKALTHIEGYTLHNPYLTQHAMQQAKNCGSLLSFDLSSFEVVRIYQEQITDLISNYVDILFANEDEANALTELAPEKACSALSQKCAISVVSLGGKGCLIGQNGQVIHVPTEPVKPVDTVGAGDLFACGFLHAHLSGASLQKSGEFACLVGAHAVQTPGADLSSEAWKRLKSQFSI